VAARLLVVLLLLLAGCGEGAPSAAERLAGADGLGRSEAEVAPYRAELARLASICRERPDELARRAIAGRDRMRELNIPDSALAVLREAADAASSRAGPRPRSCATDFADALTALEQTGR
jgi:hypothetical protein